MLLLNFVAIRWQYFTISSSLHTENIWAFALYSMARAHSAHVCIAPFSAYAFLCAILTKQNMQ